MLIGVKDKVGSESRETDLLLRLINPLREHSQKEEFKNVLCNCSIAGISHL